MSDDRLDNALRDMREEPLDPAALEAARARVWDAISGGDSTACAEFRPALPLYIDGTLLGSRRVLMDDHLGRCAACRRELAELRGERRVIPMPQRSSSSRAVRWGAAAAAAVLAVAIAYGARDTIDSMLGPDGPRATVVSAEGGLYRVPGDALQPGAEIGEKEIVRTGPGSHAVLQLADGSLVELNERTELFASAAWSGQSLHLRRGDVIVRAAKQRRGSLRVLTRDSIASVKGTVFAVSAGLGGSVVSVVEGSVEVRQPGTEVLLSPGQQAASNPALANSVVDAVAWSPDADAYLEILSSFVKIERQLAENFPGEQRTTSALLSYLPAGAFVYGAIPNLSGRLGPALSLAEQQSSENAAFGAWWSSEAGTSVRQMVERLQSVSALMGDEIVFCAAAPGGSQSLAMVMARVQPGKRAELASALEGLFAQTGDPALPYSISDDLMIVSGSPENLALAASILGQGAGSPFAAAIADRYRRGTGWLLAIDAPAVVEMAKEDDAPPVELADMIGLKYLFVEQRFPSGVKENEVTLKFDGPRTGMGAWLADSGSGGVAEYVPADSLLAGYVSMREPWQLFQEFTALMTARSDSFGDNLAEIEQKFGAGFIANLTGALGNEAAFTLNGFSMTGPAWSLVAVAYNPALIDSSLQRFIDVFNAELQVDEQRFTFRQEEAGGRTWNSLSSGALPVGVTWTYDAGYLVAASDRATAERTIATRSAGSPLVWSAPFLQQLPSSAGLHPSAFVWLNTRGALSTFAGLAPTPALGELLAERDPVLVVFDGKPDQIHGASRTRLSGLILDAMLLRGLTRMGQDQPTPTEIVGP